MNAGAQWSALSSAASYSKVPINSITTKLCCPGRHKSHPSVTVKVAWADAQGVPRKRAQNTDLPRFQPKNKKKPWITPPKPGGFLRKLKRGPPTLRTLPAPANGLLVPKLIPVAHQVLKDRSLVMGLVPKLMQVVRTHNCKYCTDTHVGPVGHGIASCTGPDCTERRARHDWTRAKPSDVFPSLDAYHLYDRLKTIHHLERRSAQRLPAIVELCIQAGVDLPEYPVLRRIRPVKALGKSIVEETYGPLFEFDGELDPFYLEVNSFLETKDNHKSSNLDGSDEDEISDEEELENDSDIDDTVDQPEPMGFEELEEVEVGTRILNHRVDLSALSLEEVAQVAQITLNAWERMRKGVRKLMFRYNVRVCGYCPEVHIGPKGHKVKLCGAFKHQWRDGQHGWQKATLENLIPPKYVWHVKDLQAPFLHNQLRRYYGQAPAVVELCVQAGAVIPDAFRPMMRIDVAVPDIDEMYNAV